MFAPMSPLTERTRIKNERLLAEQHREASFALPKLNTAPLRKLFSVRRPATVPQLRAAAEVSECSCA
jgi:hypothetical protein